MSDPGGRRGGWRIEFGPGGPGRPRGPRGGGGGRSGGDGPSWPQFGRRGRAVLAAVLVLVLLVVVVFLRPVLHGPLMWVWRAPLPWLVALLVLVIGRWRAAALG